MKEYTFLTFLYVRNRYIYLTVRTSSECNSIHNSKFKFDI